MAQVGRISGPLLEANLLRDGRPSGSTENNLTFRNTLDDTQLLFLDVNNGKIAVNTGTATRELDVIGTTQSTNLISTTSLNTPGYEITDSTFRVLLGDIYLDAADAVVMANMENGTIRISDNTISTIISNADVDLTPYKFGTEAYRFEVPSNSSAPYTYAYVDNYNALFGADYYIRYINYEGITIGSMGSGSGYGTFSAGEIINGIDGHTYQIGTFQGSGGAQYGISEDDPSNPDNYYSVRRLDKEVPRVGSVDITNDLNVYGNIYTPGTITFGGTITLGDADTDNVTFNSDITSDIIPDATDTYNLGSYNRRWSYLYTNLINGQAVSTDELGVGGINIKHKNGGQLYVAQNGNDSNHGDHPLAPFATIARALQAAAASGTQPFVINVSPGEYQEALPLVVPPNVSIVGEDIRNCIIMPDTSSQSEDVFHLDDTNTIANLTIKDFYYDSVNNTGYAFRFSPGAVISNRSPYIQNITVLTNETSGGSTPADIYVDPEGLGLSFSANSVSVTQSGHSEALVASWVGKILVTYIDDVNPPSFYTVTGYSDEPDDPGVLWRIELGETFNFAEQGFLFSIYPNDGETIIVGSASTVFEYNNARSYAKSSLPPFFNTTVGEFWTCQYGEGVNVIDFIEEDPDNSSWWKVHFKDVATFSYGLPIFTSPTAGGTIQAGRGAWIDGDELGATTVEKSMLFHSCTFITPNADVINMTNNVRVEWLNSFTYYANKGLYAFAGTSGGAELRSIGSANVYGNYGAVADGADTLMYLIQHNFGYIGSGTDRTNDPSTVIQANEIVELNSGQIHFVSTDQAGNFRVGDNFYVNLEDGSTSLSFDTGDFESLSGIVINQNGNITYVAGDNLETGNIRVFDNNIVSLNGDLNLEAATNTVNINSNTNIDGYLRIRDNFSFGGTLNLAGDQTTDRVDFNVNFEQNFNPNQHLTFDLGKLDKKWLNVYLNRAEPGNIIIDDNFITSDTSNADLELRANGTGTILIPNNNIQVNNNLTVSGLTDLQDTSITGLLSQTGDRNQTGNYNVTNVNISNDLEIGSQAQFEEILFDGNAVSTTTSNTDLELRANGTGKIVVPYNDVVIINDVSISDVLQDNNINVNLETTFDEATVNDITISENYITTNNGNLNLELLANGTGTVTLNSNVVVDNDLTVVDATTLKNSYISYTYGPELVVNGTFTTNLTSWTASGGGTASVVSGTMYINAATSARNMSQTISVGIGKTYVFSIDLVSATLGAPDPADEYYVRVTAPGVGTLLEWTDATLEGNTPITLTDSFVAPTSTVSIIIRASNAIVQVDNVSIVEDIGLVEYITPIDVTLENLTQTGNTVVAGNYTQTGDTIIDGNLTVSSDVTLRNFKFEDNVLRNYREDLRLNPSNPYNPLSLPQIVKAMQQSGVTADDYTEQTEKNLVNFLANGTVPPYAYSYIDVNSSGTVTSGDALAWLQYVANGSTPDPIQNQFIYNVVELLLEDEFANPGKYNSNLFLGDYYRADMILEASGSGQISFPSNDVRIANNLTTANIFADNINITQTISLNEIIITDAIIEIDDNFISTTISNANLELRANRDIVIPTNDVVIENDLTVNTPVALSDIPITGTLTHTGDRNQTGNLSVVGNVTVSSTNINSEIQFDDIEFNDNYIQTTNSNADLELRANGVGKLIVPENNVRIVNDVNLGTLTSANINTTNDVSAEIFEASSNIRLFDNVITTTESNSNLELRSFNSNIKLENFLFNDATVRTTSSNIDLVANSNLNINSNGALKLPVGTTAQRQIASNNIRFNSTDSVFEAFNNSATITFNGIYSSNRATRLIAHPTNNTISMIVSGATVGTVNSTGLVTNGLEIDDISIQSNIIRTDVTNSDLELRTNGNGALILYDVSITDNVIENTSGSTLNIGITGYGKVKFADTNAIRIPAGTDAERPSSPETGMMRWSTENEILEVWDGSTFVTAAGTSATISAAEMEDLILEYTLVFG